MRDINLIILNFRRRLSVPSMKEETYRGKIDRIKNSS